MSNLERIAHVLLIIGQVVVLVALISMDFSDEIMYRKYLSTILSTILIGVVANFLELRRRGK